MNMYITSIPEEKKQQQKEDMQDSQGLRGRQLEFSPRDRRWRHAPLVGTLG
jgi:hypothetical protein